MGAIHVRFCCLKAGQPQIASVFRFGLPVNPQNRGHPEKGHKNNVDPRSINPRLIFSGGLPFFIGGSEQAESKEHQGAVPENRAQLMNSSIYISQNLSSSCMAHYKCMSGGEPIWTGPSHTELRGGEGCGVPGRQADLSNYCFVFCCCLVLFICWQGAAKKQSVRATIPRVERKLLVESVFIDSSSVRYCHSHARGRVFVA